MRNKLVQFFKKTFIRNVITMASGTIAAQAVAMGLSPIITRLYGPENYGLMGVFMAIVIIIAPISALTYPIAIVLPKSDKDAKGIIRLSLYIATTIAFIVSIVLLLFNEQIVNLFQIKDVASYLYLIPIVILGAGFLQVTEQWLIRKKRFRVSAKAAFLQAIVIQGGKASFGLFAPFASVLILLSAIAETVKASLMLLFAKKSKTNKLIGEKALENEGEASVKELAKKHRDFPLYRAPQVFLSGTSQSLPILLLSTFFGPAAAGFYSIGRTVLNIPSQLIGKSVGDVFYPRISEAANNGENLTQLIRKATLLLAAIGFIPFGLVVAFGPWLFSFVFGEEWLVAGRYARWMAIWMFFMFINQPSVKALPVLSAQRFQLLFTIFTLIFRTTALFIGFLVYESDITAVALFGVAGAISNILLITITIKKSQTLKRAMEAN